MVTIDGQRQKQNNKASAEGARFPRGAMLLRDIIKFTKPSMDAFCPFELISRACQGPRGPLNSINVDFYKNKLTQSIILTFRLLLNEVCFDVLLAARLFEAMIRYRKVLQRLQTKCGALRHGWQHVVHGSKTRRARRPVPKREFESQRHVALTPTFKNTMYA